MYGLKALIFDVDGTIADTERDGHRPAFNAAFAAAGLDWHWDPALYGELLAVTGGKERIRYFMQRAGITLDPSVDVEASIAALHRDKTAHYVKLLRQGAIPLRPGVLRLWREARAAGVRLAIATTTTPENVIALLEHAGEPGLASWFEVIAAGDVVPNKKPAPDIFTYALEQLDLKPEDCLAIEDSDNGAQAALAAGIRALVVTVNAYTADQDFGAAALVVDQLGEPDSPVRVLAGDLGGRAWVDLAVLTQLAADCYRAR
ncbi:haloacid dehalogenase superfamily, subfamily IA, variant 3 with third motif having DD or ED [Allochromatium warmingii]|uniref:Haloacid dehalogenase superfamily, subfamily IA, variant 3 with third motif having DD or ED n=1 Tax=Allochromatium warmingii TaxID=61595 RepID=A0A1H3CVG4_ALLWA|nr:HAD-IA family hydrolase [Allochromatium warmingii]SDX58076.1 haloacid dehalogenase superfamily, subfamily IA, variant 3 with third motif having DD or ED [Allochromatium warmingii]